MNSSIEGLVLFNTLTRRKEKFISIDSDRVRMYTCGPTVYDFAHVGNFRAFIFEDLLKRWLEYRGFRVIHVMNITDVDDKTIKASQEKRLTLKRYTEFYVKAFFESLASLNIERADYYPKATEHIPEMVTLVNKLIKKGYAYKGEDSSIYFAINKFRDYGKLSKTKVKELRSCARVRVDEYAKEDAQDFALWKAWTKNDGQVFWNTELGKGRPGWHVECSAMSMKYLGETFDIHCGGVDNIFPHHENEIAQSETATGKKFVNYWLHNEYLLVQGKRMAKSLGNFYTLRDLLSKGYDPKAIRYLLLSTHYRQQLNFTFEGLEAAKGAIDRLRNFMSRLQSAAGEGSGEKIRQMLKKVEMNFGEAMDDDLNISAALASIFNFVREFNNLLDKKAVDKDEAREIYDLMTDFDRVLGVIGEVKMEEKLPKRAQTLIDKREDARKAKDWKTADAIRLKLKSMGIIIEDTPQGIRWKLEKG